MLFLASAISQAKLKTLPRDTPKAIPSTGTGSTSATLKTPIKKSEKKLELFITPIKNKEKIMVRIAAAIFINSGFLVSPKA